MRMAILSNGVSYFAKKKKKKISSGKTDDTSMSNVFNFCTSAKRNEVRAVHILEGDPRRFPDAIDFPFSIDSAESANSMVNEPPA